MMRIGKRSLCKFGVFMVTIVLLVYAAMTVMSPRREIVADQKTNKNFQISQRSSDARAHKQPNAAGRANNRLAHRRPFDLGPNKYLSKNVSWVFKSLLGKSKTNITMKIVPINNTARDKKNVVGYRPKVLKSKEDIRQVLEQLQRKKEQRKEEMVKLASMSRKSNQDIGSCRPIGNVAYIKTHKTASTTLQTVVNRFGLLNKLSFVVNKISPNNGHFVYIPVTEHSPRLFFLPPLGVGNKNFSYFQYNMIAVHLRYNRSAMDSFMMPGTKYISIIREPSSHFESAFNHFRFIDSFSPSTRCRVKGHEIEEFMRKPGYYRRRLKKLPWDTTRGLRWYYARNNQIFDLGLDSKYHNDEAIVNRTVETLIKELDLVLISEYFDESLVLLKKMLCWSFDDIVYISKNQRPIRVELSEDTRQKIRKWSRADTILYERFNATLWQKIRQYGPDFEHDLATFRKRKDEVFSKCVAGEIVKSHGIFKHKEYAPSTNSSLFCTLVAESKTRLFFRIWQRQAGSWGAKMRALRKRNRTRANQSQPGSKDQRLDLGGHRTQNKAPNHAADLTKKNDNTGEVVNEIEKEDEESIPRQRGNPEDCEKIVPETDIDFQSSDGYKLVFPEEI